ncbi:MAG: hypothetical protein Q4F00_13060 [bacterium]|nr:hypothetical protein [bacterium]
MAKVSPAVLEKIRSEALIIAGQTGLIEQGVTVKNVEYVREAGIWYLRVSLTKKSGVSVSDCETLHRPLSKRLDEMDPISEPYYLEVCSEPSEPQLNDEEIASASVPNSLAKEKQDE